MNIITKLKALETLDKNSITIEEVKNAFALFCSLINEKNNIQEYIKGKDISIILRLKEVGPFFLTIQEGYAESGVGIITNYDFSLTSNIDVVFKLIRGLVDPIEAFFSELFLIKGDLYYMIEFFQILEFIIINFYKEKDSKARFILDSISLKKLFDIYARGSSVLEPIHIPLFFEILTAFANNNAKAKKLISEKNIIIQMNIVDGGKYFIRIMDNKLGWAIGEARNPNLRFEMGFKTSAEVIFETDPISAFMKGKIKVEAKENDIFKVLILKDLTDLLLEFLNL
ncbi:MAG: SCP2 sterol-binding domain-containing protein [Promethearchaeota archaeon]